MPRAIAFLLAWSIQVSPAAQYRPYRVDHWTTDNGLPHNTIKAIVQTRDGYLWLTTFDSLARFDGLRFNVFDRNNTPAVTNNRFTALTRPLRSPHSTSKTSSPLSILKPQPALQVASATSVFG